MVRTYKVVYEDSNGVERYLESGPNTAGWPSNFTFSDDPAKAYLYPTDTTAESAVDWVRKQTGGGRGTYFVR